jgi:hypothetical protein
VVAGTQPGNHPLGTAGYSRLPLVPMPAPRIAAGLFSDSPAGCFSASARRQHTFAPTLDWQTSPGRPAQALGLHSRRQRRRAAAR